MGGQTMEERAQACARRWRSRAGSTRCRSPPSPWCAGAAAGAGLSLALACDMRIASDTVSSATAFARVGYSGDFGGSYFLTQLVGTAKARELYYTPRSVDAQQALGLGLVNRVVPDARLEEETMALAARLARGPAGGLSLHEAQHERGGERDAQGHARPRGLEPHAHRHDRGPPRGGPRLRGEARAAVQGTLTSSEAPLEPPRRAPARRSKRLIGRAPPRRESARAVACTPCPRSTAAGR